MDLGNVSNKRSGPDGRNGCTGQQGHVDLQGIIVIRLRTAAFEAEDMRTHEQGQSFPTLFAGRDHINGRYDDIADRADQPGPIS